MGVLYSPKIVTDGLVLALDAANPKSYPGSGTTWTDLSGNGNNGTLTNGPTFDSGNGGSLSFDGSNDYVNIDSVASNLASSNFTLEAMIKGPSQDHKGIIVVNTSTGGNRALWFIRTAGMGIYDGGTWYVGNVNVGDNKWHHVVITYVIASKNAIIYTDGSISLNVTTNNTISIASNDKFSVGQDWDGVSVTDVFTGNISLAKIYNRALSAKEVLQNYNATKSRYNL